MAALAETALVERKAADISRDALAMRVADARQYEAAAHMLRMLTLTLDEIAATFDPVIKAAFDSHRAALAAKAQHAEPVKAAQRHLKSVMGLYEAEQDRLRRVEQLRLQAEAQAEAEAEARAEAEERALQTAVEAEQRGVDVDVEALAEAELAAAGPVYAAPVVTAPAAPRVAGVSSRETWRAEVTDLAALVRAVAGGQVPITALEANMVFLGQQARSLKSLLAYPGVRAVAERTVSVHR